MTKKDIELLFKSESYKDAIKLLKKALQEDSSNAEWFYYLFLAENGDYANINLDDIVSEIDFNRALDLANTRLRATFTSEYNFYKAVDPNLRKYFAYAGRGNLEKFASYVNSYGYKETKLIHDKSDKKEFLSNLDFLVTSRVNHQIVDMNLLSLNILYLATKDEEILDVWNVLKERALEIGTYLAKADLGKNIDDIKEYLFILTSAKKAQSKEEKEEEEKRIALAALAKNLEEETERIEKEKETLQAAQSAFNDHVSQAENNEPATSNSNERPRYFKFLGIPIKVAALLFSIGQIIVFVFKVVLVSSGVSEMLDTVDVFSTIFLLLSVFTFIFSIIAMRRPTRTQNGSIPGLIISIVGISYYILGLLFTSIYSATASYAY